VDGLEKPLVVDTSPLRSAETPRRWVWPAIGRVLQSIATIVKGVTMPTIWVSMYDLDGVHAE
jgi:hypothetical protein